jgi:Domain of unknown function (DUF5666)
MTANPYGQPEPFDPGAVQTRAVRTSPQASPGSRRMLAPILAGVLVAAVAFAGGFAVANATSTKAVTGTNGFGDANGQGFGPNASGRPRNGNGFGGGASGTVGSVSSNQMTITTQAGGQRIVLLTPTTTIEQVTAATKAVSDIAPGATVTVVGTANPDGSVTATRVIIGDVSIFGRGPGGGGVGNGGPNGSPAPSSAP